MVRLVVVYPPPENPWLSDFNSSMVRLVASEVKADQLALLIFQFQYGAIGSMQSQELIKWKYNFNSSMVRLVAFFLWNYTK